MGKYFQVILLIVLIILLSSTKAISQVKVSTGTKLLDSYLINEQTKQADSALQSQIEVFKQAKQIEFPSEVHCICGKSCSLKK